MTSPQRELKGGQKDMLTKNSLIIQNLERARILLPPTLVV